MSVCLMLLRAFLLSAIAVYASAALPEGVQLVGRFLEYNGSYAADWPASTIKFLLKASSDRPTVTLRFQDGADLDRIFLGVAVNCQDAGKVEVNRNSLVVDFQLSSTRAGELAEVSFVKLTEANYGEATGRMALQSVAATGATILPPSDPAALSHASPCPQTKALLFLGDSITAAYGVDGSPPCSFSAESQNVRHSYAFLLSQYFNASYQLLAWSGKGVVRNYGDENKVSADPLPFYYNRTVAVEEGSYYPPGGFSPQAIVLMLGTNDYSTDPVPDTDVFVAGYVALVRRLQGDYPGVPIVAACEPLQRDAQCNNIYSASMQSQAIFIDVVPSVFDGGYGCDGHPSYETQKKIAQQLYWPLSRLLN